jgi:serine/threonine protein kinase
MMPSDQFEVGDEINGTYRVQEKLAEGGMGAIYKVEHRAFGLPYALKVSHFEGDEQGREAIWQRFKKEAQTLAHLHHKNIVSVFDFGRTKDGAPFYVMDYIVGQNLTQWIRKGGQIPWEKAFYIFIEIADGLAYAHAQGVVHRDIKPSNIMVAGVPGTPTLQVKIVDFGIACETLPEMARENDVNSAGSPPYMSPEQLYNRPIDSRSDIYSLGCTLFEVLTGVPPFVGDNALEIAMKHASVEPPSLKEATLGQNFPEAVETMITKLLQKDPQRRYQNIEIVAREMRALLDPSNKPEPPPGAVTSREPNYPPVSGTSTARP